MKKVLFAVVAAAVALTFALPAMAEEAKKDAKPSKRSYTGDIKAVDAAKQSLTVAKKEGDEKTFTLGEKAKISTKDKAAAEIADLKVGDKVTVTFTEQDGKNVASKVAPPAPPKEKKEKKDKPAAS